MVFIWDPDAPIPFKAICVTGFIFGTMTSILSLWCFTVILLSEKLRKPLWYFRASFCIKDIVLCVVVLFPNLSSYSSKKIDEARLYHPYLATATIAAISSYVFSLLCASLDRYHAATRPFRYHMGELMPNGVSLTLIFYCWMFGILTAICVITDYPDTGRQSYGVLLQLVLLRRWQKALLLGGITAVYCISALFLFSALSSVGQQKRESRSRLKDGEEEPIRSRRNSVSEDQHCDQPSTSDSPAGDAEAKADRILFEIEEPGAGAKKAKRRWSLGLTQKLVFFTPTTYRPSILRRIRNTWYLYVVVITWAISFFTTILPFYYVIIGAEQCKNVWITGEIHSDDSPFLNSTAAEDFAESASYETSASCIFSGIADCLILGQGFLCVITYVFADDVFRPRFLWPVAILLSLLQCRNRRRGSESSYTAGRKRTLSRNSNTVNFSL